jgi:nucleotide-binding universal stress UspA family protein
MQAGRPVLISANGSESCLAKKVVISWKDTGESRRAVSDAVPLLAEASEVLIATVADTLHDEAVESLKDVGEFLRSHGIKSRHEVLTGEDAGMRLIELTRTMRADVVVSGAYGHSRLREWVFGGVTRTLLDETALHRFMSS